jgi:hypothetical protein
MWFSLAQHFGFITPGGAVTEFPIQLPPNQSENVAPGIARDEPGHIWIPIFKDEEPPYGGFLARIDVARGAREKLLTTPCQEVGAPVEGSDGLIYAPCAHVVGSQQVIDLMLIRPNGEMRIIADPYQITPNPYNPNSSQYMTATPGKIWFVTGSPWGELGVYDIVTARFQAYAPTDGGTASTGADEAGHIGFESALRSGIAIRNVLPPLVPPTPGPVKLLQQRRTTTPA